MADVRTYHTVGELCPNVGAPVVGPTALIGDVEYAPCPRCEGAPTPVFRTSEGSRGRRVYRYKTHDRREREL